MKNLNKVNKLAIALCNKKYQKSYFGPGVVLFNDTPPIDYHVYVLFDDAPICRWLKMFDKIAITIGEVVIIREKYLTPALIRHERVHVDQWRNSGPIFGWKYAMNPSKYEDAAEDAENLKGPIA